MIRNSYSNIVHYRQRIFAVHYTEYLGWRDLRMDGMNSLSLSHTHTHTHLRQDGNEDRKCIEVSKTSLSATLVFPAPLELKKLLSVFLVSRCPSHKLRYEWTQQKHRFRDNNYAGVVPGLSHAYIMLSLFIQKPPNSHPAELTGLIE